MLHEQYRPRTFAEFVGNKDTVERLQRMLSRKSFNKGAIWLSGPPSTGKTTLANIIARTLADDFDIAELDGERCTVDAVRDIDDTLKISPMFGSWKVVVVNESHGMTAKAVQAWLTLLDRLPEHRLIVFTTTETGDLFGNFTEPMLTRCYRFELNRDDREAIIARVQSIAESEGLHSPTNDYARLVQECNGNIRDAICRVGNENIPQLGVVKPRKLSAIEEMRQKYKIA